MLSIKGGKCWKCCISGQEWTNLWGLKLKTGSYYLVFKYTVAVLHLQNSYSYSYRILTVVYSSVIHSCILVTVLGLYSIYSIKYIVTVQVLKKPDSLLGKNTLSV